MQILDKLLTLGVNHGRPGRAMTPKGIVLHYIGNPGSSAIANRNYFENGAGGNYTSVHYIVGLQGEILRLIPENECAQHAGKSYAPQYAEQAKKNNGMYIGIETCHPDASGRFSDVTHKALVELCADICKRYGFDVDQHVIRHYDCTGKSCPFYHVKYPDEWTKLKADIKKAMQPAESTVRFDLFGEKVVEIPGKVTDGTTYVKARALLEAMGLNVGWDGGTDTVVVRTKK